MAKRRTGRRTTGRKSRRPPKKWFAKCVRGVRRSSPRISNPRAVCGALWYRKMSPASRKRVTRKYERTRRASYYVMDGTGKRVLDGPFDTYSDANGVAQRRGGIVSLRRAA